METSRELRRNILLLFLSGILFIVATILPWDGYYSLWQLYSNYYMFDSYYILNLIPLVIGIILTICSFGLISSKSSIRLSAIIISLISINIIFYFLIATVNLSSESIWENSPIYLIFSGIAFFLFGMILEFARNKNHNS